MNTVTINNDVKFLNRNKNTQKNKESIDSFFYVFNNTIDDSRTHNEIDNKRTKNNNETEKLKQTTNTKIISTNDSKDKVNNSENKEIKNEINEDIILENLFYDINIFEINDSVNKLKNFTNENEINGNISDLIKNIEIILENQDLQKKDLVNLIELFNELQDYFKSKDFNEVFNSKIEKLANIIESLEEFNKNVEIYNLSQLKQNEESKIKIESTETVKLDGEVSKVDNSKLSSEENQNDLLNDKNKTDNKLNIDKDNSNNSAVNFDLNSEINVKESVELRNFDEINKNEIKKSLFEQVIKNIKINVSNDKSEIKINLKPDFLGDMTLDIITKNGIVEAKALVKNNLIKEIIENNLVEFKENLKANGIDLEKFDVVVEKEMNFNQQNSSFSWNNNKNNKNRKNGYKETELLYFEDIDTNNNEVSIGRLDLKA